MTADSNAIRNELWLLELLVEDRVPLPWIGMPDLHHFLNRPKYEISFEDVKTTVWELSKKKYVNVTSPKGSVVDILTRNDLGDFMRGREHTHRHEYDMLGLTKTGGARWECLATVDWCKFIRVLEIYSRNSKTVRFEVIATERDRARAIISQFRHQFGSSSVSVEEERKEPFQATYWKLLPSGYEMQIWIADTRQSFDWGPLSGYRDWFERK